MIFFNRASGGDGAGNLGSFTVIGDVYGVTVNRPSTQEGDPKAIYDALNILDDDGPEGEDIDFSVYDNWTFRKNDSNWVHENIADGVLDQIFVFYKQPPLDEDAEYGGYSILGTRFSSNDNVI